MDEVGFVNKILAAVGLEQGHLFAVLVGLLVCWGSTQALKIVFALKGNAVRVTAWAVALFAAYTAAPPEGLVKEGFDWAAFWVSSATALNATLIYDWLKHFAESRGWALAKAMAARQAKQDFSIVK